MILISDIQFVIVLYKCKLQDSATFLSITAALETESIDTKVDLYVYDNSPYKQEPTVSSEHWTITYKSDILNTGLSSAYNVAASHARTSEKKFLLLLDQDTEFPLNTITVYLESINNNLNVKLFAPILKIQNGKIMSPCRYVNKWGKLIDHIAPGINSLDNYVPVNSGLCVSLEHYFASGQYNEKIRVDGADFQFIERFKKKIETRFYVLDLQIEQDFSLFESDINNILTRFKIFLIDVKNFDREDWKDDYYYGRIALIRTIKLLLQTKKRVIFDYYVKYYL
jgi:GT2 family glycosyltransferase